jgi:hypothetical protein
VAAQAPASRRKAKLSVFSFQSSVIGASGEKASGGFSSLALVTDDFRLITDSFRVMSGSACAILFGSACALEGRFVQES